MMKNFVLLAAFGFIGCATAQTRSAEIKAADGTVVVVNVDPVTRKVTAVESADAVMRGVDMVLGPAGMRGSEMSLRWHFAVFLRRDVQPKRIVVEDVTASPIRLLVDDVSPSLEGQVWAKSSRAVPLAGPLLADFNSGDFGCHFQSQHYVAERHSDTSISIRCLRAEYEGRDAQNCVGGEQVSIFVCGDELAASVVNLAR